MATKKTQDECLDDFINVLKDTHTKLFRIDVETPFSAHEPDWWLDMQDLVKKIIELENKYSK